MSSAHEPHGVIIGDARRGLPPHWHSRALCQLSSGVLLEHRLSVLLPCHTLSQPEDRRAAAWEELPPVA